MTELYLCHVSRVSSSYKCNIYEQIVRYLLQNCISNNKCNSYAYLLGCLFYLIFSQIIACDCSCNCVILFTFSKLSCERSSIMPNFFIRQVQKLRRILCYQGNKAIHLALYKLYNMSILLYWVYCLLCSVDVCVLCCSQ
jgi:hypothetical protein